jgi:uncharacterized protein (DUF1778 family)
MRLHMAMLESLKVRVSHEERARIERAARARGISLSELVRSSVLDEAQRGEMH